MAIHYGDSWDPMTIGTRPSTRSISTALQDKALPALRNSPENHGSAGAPSPKNRERMTIPQSRAALRSIYADHVQRLLLDAWRPA